MNSHIGLGIFGTFGEPFGFQQAFYYGAQYRNSLDLDEKEIEFYPGADLYAVRREVVDGVHFICICIYSYAQELNTDRLGTFLGSCMVLQDGFTEAEYAAKVLQSLHDDLMTNEHNVLESVIQVEKASDIIIREPAEFVAVQANVIPLNKTPFYSAFADTSKKILVLPSAKSFGNKETEVFEFLDEALKHYGDTGTIYFSFDRNVYDFVRSAGKIEIMEWDEYVGRKEAMLRSTAVRTKKGIQKNVPQSVEFVALPEISNEEVKQEEPEQRDDEIVPVAAGLTQNREWHDDDILPSADPYKPFTRWQQPEEVWNEEEIKERVTEYNRLFNYTNTLIDHINEENTFVVRQNRKRQVLVAALLLLLISGSVAVYFLGMYKPATDTKIVAAVPETPHTIGNKQVIVNNDTFIAAPSQNAANGTTPDIAAISAFQDSATERTPGQKNAVKEVRQAQATPTDFEYELEEYDDESVVPTRPVAKSTTMPSSNTSTSYVANLPPTPASTDSTTIVPSRSGVMPRINLPGATHSNLPATAIYTSKVKPDSQQSAVTSVTKKLPGAPNGTKPGAAMPPLPKPQATSYAQPSDANAPVWVKTDTKATYTFPSHTVAVTSGSKPPISENFITGVPATTRTVTPAPVTINSTTVTTGNVTTNPLASPVLANTVTTPSKPLVFSVNPLPATVHSFAATAKTQRVTTVAIPASLAAVVPNKSTSDVTGWDTAKKMVSASKPISALPRQEPVRSGVSDGEMNRANAVIMPQLAVASRPASPEMKMKTLSPRPNGFITQRDVPQLYQTGIKNKTLTELTRIILDNAPEMVGNYYKGQELQYAAALLNGNRQAFERRGDDYVCTGDYLILHIPAILKPRRPVANPK